MIFLLFYIKKGRKGKNTEGSSNFHFRILSHSVRAWKNANVKTYNFAKKNSTYEA
jgi:hypothetical protein